MPGFIAFMIILFILLFPFIVFLIYFENKKKEKFISELYASFNAEPAYKNKLVFQKDGQVVRGEFVSQNKAYYFKVNIYPADSSRYGIELKKQFALMGLLEDDIKIGDDYFDKSVFIRYSSNKDVFSKLSHHIRTVILNALSTYKFDFKIENNNIEYSYLFSYQKGLDFYHNMIEVFLSVSKELSENITYEDRCMKNISAEYNKAVKRNMMESFVKNLYITNGKITEFFRKMENDYDPVISLCASYALKKEGIDNLLSYLKSSDDTLVLKALSYLERQYYNIKDKNTIYSLLFNGSKSVIENAIDIFLRNNDKDCTENIIKFIQREKYVIDNSNEIKYKITKLIAQIKISDADDFLINNLKQKNKPEIVLTTLNAMVNLNNLKFVEFILPYTKGFHSTEIKNAAKQTISILQQNVSQSNRGDLTISEINNGELTISDENESGNLSMDNEKV